MATTKAKIDGNRRHMDKLMRIVIQPYKEMGEDIKTAARAAGQSTSAYIMQAIVERMERDRLGRMELSETISEVEVDI